MRAKLLVVAAVAALSPASLSAQTPLREAPAPADSIPERWTYSEHFNAPAPTDDAWWHNFDDSLLDSLIARGLAYNYDAAMALKRIDVARNEVGLARAGYYPTVGVSAGWVKTRTSGATYSTPTKAVGLDYWQLGASMSWEVDLFGKVRSQVEAKKADVRLSAADYAGVQLSVASEIATYYITLRTYQAQLEVANQHIASQQKIVTMTEARHEAGLASSLDVAQAKMVLYSTQASIPQLQASIKTTVNALCVLVGEYPDQTTLGLLTPRPLPNQFHLVGIGVPMDLLRRRPDIIAAECQLAADAASIGVAKKDFLPTLTLEGSIGTSAHKFGDLFTDDSFTYTIAPTLSWTVFSGLSRKYALHEAKNAMAIDVDSYNLTVRTAVEEVDNAIITYGGTLQNISLLEQTVDEARRSLELSVDLYKNSLESFTTVVNSQMNLLTYQNSLVAAQGNALQSLITLYKALGGGWTVNL